ncbi:MAG TPA: segregation/condensation protein A, partial [Acidobacteriota bacterium]|nr:segregation/condensation protein A [Acidobacteriota bacterium]
MVAEADYRIKLPVFEGPLDLLLFLIRKNELDIYDIPIESVTKQYLEVLYAMKELELEVAGDFFVMAATLMEIKSRMLLPKHQQAIDPNADDEELDPRWELV